MSQELTIIDEDKPYYFTIAPRVDDKGGKGMGKLFLVQTKDWEPADGSIPWRLALHPWTGGLGPSRLNPSITLGGDLKNRPSMTYAKGNLDASFDVFATFPPLYTSLSYDVTTYSTTYLSTVNQLKYDVAQYGNVTYMGVASSGLNQLAVAVRNYNGRAYFAGGQYLFSIDNSLTTLNLVKDFGAGKVVYDIEPFNDELVIAMGETEKLWTMDSSEAFTQATNATYAIALGRTNELLWRAESVNKISNCITAPRTLTSWTPASPSQYSAGDTSYSITDLVEYAGSIVAIKPDGAYLADGETNFHNQTPQLLTYPDDENGKRSWTAWGFLWIPSIIGLIRMSIGEAVVVGPELSQRPDFRFHVHAGVEWNGAMYLLCHDHGEVEELFICKMVRDRSGNSPNQYIYHEWCRLGTTNEGSVAVVYTGGTNPTLIVGRSTGLALITLGRGSGSDIDDANYPYGTNFILEPGLVVPSSDLGIEIDLVGMKIVGKQVVGGTITIQHDMDDSGTWKNLESTVDGSGKVTIEDEGWFTATRYAQPNTVGRALYTRVIGTMPSGQLGTDRTEIYEIWAFGNAHPESTEIITVDIYSDIKARVRGLIQGRKRNRNNFRILREWAYANKIIEIKLPGYDDDQHIRCMILEVNDSNTSVIRSGSEDLPSNVTRIVLRRIDFSGDLNG